MTAQLQALSNLAQDTSRDEAVTAALGACVSVLPPSEGAILCVGCHFESQKTLQHLQGAQVALPGPLLAMWVH